MNIDILKEIKEACLIPVVAFDDADQVAPAVQALRDAGLNIIEITMRTPAGSEAIRRVRKMFSDMIVGAGTVLTLASAEAVIDAGSSFIVTPGYDREIVTWCIRNHVTIIPGCVTPTEIQMALADGITLLKFFPANAFGGIDTMRALHAPFASYGVGFIPTGGIDNSNLATYIKEPFVAAVGGGWLCSSKHLKNEDYAGIRQAAEKALAIAQNNGRVEKNG